MGFRDQLKALIVPEKDKEFEKIADVLDETLAGYDKDIKKLKADLRAKDGIKPEDFTALESENTELKRINGEQAKILKKAEGERETYKATADMKTASLHKLIRDEGLTRALVEIGVKNPARLKGAHAMLRDGLQVDEEKGVAFAQDKDGKRVELVDYLKGWAASDDGKEYVSVPTSSGGGAQGSGGAAGTGLTMKLAEFNAMSPAAQMDFVTVKGGHVE